MKLLLSFASSAVVLSFVPLACGAYIWKPFGEVVSTTIVDYSPVTSVFFPVPTVVSYTAEGAAPTMVTFPSLNNVTTVVFSSVAGVSTPTAPSPSPSFVVIGNNTTSLGGPTTPSVTPSFVGAGCPVISNLPVFTVPFPVPTTTAGITAVTLPASNGTAICNTTAFAFPTTTANNNTTAIITVTVPASNGTEISSSTIVITVVFPTATSGPQSIGVANVTSSFFGPCPTISGSPVAVSTTTANVPTTTSVNITTTTGIVSSTVPASNATVTGGPQTTTIIPVSNITSSI
ncbi:hypothetical protein ARMGADRAFT_1098426 [Armillaria gallica]|uniref:Uncharacterized protein n=1 Tax=Armillaria gallica TaxID=47427 RepID=A0A2H3CMD5_ARMGA|nr:hypothetical protein ARMGADRAFT_1098426 [Armillaria gallica]